MIIVVEGASAAGKTTWCRRLPRDQVLLEGEPTPSPPPAGSGDPSPSDPRSVAEYWANENSRRWRAACAVSDRYGWAVCDTDPFKLHWTWTLWMSGLSSDEYWEQSKKSMREAFANGKLGFPDLVLFADPDIETLRRQKANDLTRTRNRHEMHIRIAPALKRWYLAMATLDPDRINFGLPVNGLDTRHTRLGQRAVRTGAELFDRFITELDRQR